MRDLKKKLRDCPKIKFNIYVMRNLLLFEDFNEVLLLEKNIPTDSALWSQCKEYITQKITQHI